MKKKVIIVGCGFAGLSAARVFAECRGKIEVTVIDKKKYFDFLPLLPDVIGREIVPDFLRCPIEYLEKKFGFNFVRQPVDNVDIENNKIFTPAGEFTYDYLIIAGGSETNFYRNDEIRKSAYKLDDADDAAKISRVVRENKFDSYVVCGGGYTGIEIAVNISRYLSKNKKKGKIFIVEKAVSVLGLLPQWMKNYVLDNLERLNIEVLTGRTVEKVRGKKVFISGGKFFENALLIWCAGVKTPDFVNSINIEKNPQGRLKIDEYLRVKENVFAAGDTACLPYGNDCLRMAVQFSIAEARKAALNIVNLVNNKKKLEKYRPVDLGYIIPMANNISCGIVFGLKVKGKLATLLHYFMCIFRSYGLRNKAGIVKNLLMGGG